MSVEQISGSLPGAARGIANRLVLDGAPSLADNLNVGQIIKGRVLRHYEGKRYQVQFMGREWIADSAIPLRTDEVIYGKVLALGERVELQRLSNEKLFVEQKQEASGSRLDNVAQTFLNRHEQIIEKLFSRYGSSLSAVDKDVLLNAMRGAIKPEITARAGLFLAKLGVSQAPEFIKAINDMLMANTNKKNPVVVGFDDNTVKAESNRAGTEIPGMHAEFSLQMRHMIEDLLPRTTGKNQSNADKAAQAQNDQAGRPAPDHAADSGFSGGAQEDLSGSDLGKWLLNIQPDGSVSHRMGTIPIWLGEHLIEVNLAVFDQRGDHRQTDSIRHRQINFSLDLPMLGHLELTARVADSRVRLKIATDDPENTQALSMHLGELRGALTQRGWAVDEMSYSFQKVSDNDGAISTVVEHIIKHDSLNRVM